MVDKLASVVISTSNYGRFVTDAMESILAQTYRDFEIIVVDDGSSDDTQTKLEAYLDRITYTRQQNQGCSADTWALVGGRRRRRLCGGCTYV